MPDLADRIHRLRARDFSAVGFFQLFRRRVVLTGRPLRRQGIAPLFQECIRR